MGVYEAMKLLAFALFALVAFAQQPMIWELTGGNPHGIGSTYNIVTESVALLPAIAWTYELNQTLTWQGQQYLIPDQLYGYEDMNGSNDTEIIIIDSYQAFYSTYIDSWGINAGITVDGVSLSGAFNFGSNTNLYNAFYLEAWPGQLPLNPHFTASVNALPDTYDEAAYGQFIEFWGTHYLNRAMYGAKFNFTTIFNASFKYEYNDTWTKGQIGISIGFSEIHLGINNSWFSNTTKINQLFQNQSSTIHTVVGGDKGVFDSQGFDAWWLSCQANWDVLMETANPVPLYELIYDSPTKADNLKKSIIAYGNGKLSVQKTNPISIQE